MALPGLPLSMHVLIGSTHLWYLVEEDLTNTIWTDEIIKNHAKGSTVYRKLFVC